MDSSKLDAMIRHYAASHRNPRNEVIHCICVPAIVFAVLGLIYGLSLALALAAIAAAVIYYARLAAAAAVEMAVTLVLMLALWAIFSGGQHVMAAAIVIFIAAWIGQFVGHYFEGAKPSFLEDVQYLLIGPLYVIAILKHKFFGGPAITADALAPSAE